MLFSKADPDSDPGLAFKIVRIQADPDPGPNFLVKIYVNFLKKIIFFSNVVDPPKLRIRIQERILAFVYFADPDPDPGVFF